MIDGVGGGISFIPLAHVRRPVSNCDPKPGVLFFRIRGLALAAIQATGNAGRFGGSVKPGERISRLLTPVKLTPRGARDRWYLVTLSLHVGDRVHRVGEFEIGKIVLVDDDYAFVDFSSRHKFKTAYLPLLGLERAQPKVFDARNDRDQSG